MSDAKYLKVNTSIRTASNRNGLLKDEYGNEQAIIEMELPDNLFDDNRGPRVVDYVEMKPSKCQISMSETPICRLPLIKNWESNKISNSILSTAQLDIFPFTILRDNTIKPGNVFDESFIFPYYKDHKITIELMVDLSAHNSLFQDLILLEKYTINLSNQQTDVFSIMSPMFKQALEIAKFPVEVTKQLMNLFIPLNSSVRTHDNIVDIQSLVTLETILSNALQTALCYALTKIDLKYTIIYTDDETTGRTDLPSLTIPYPVTGTPTEVLFQKMEMVNNSISINPNAIKPKVRFEDNDFVISYDTTPFGKKIPILGNSSYVNTFENPPQLSLSTQIEELFYKPPLKRFYRYAVDGTNPTINFQLPDPMFVFGVFNIIGNKILKDTFTFLPWIKYNLLDLHISQKDQDIIPPPPPKFQVDTESYRIIGNNYTNDINIENATNTAIPCNYYRINPKTNVINAINPELAIHKIVIPLERDPNTGYWNPKPNQTMEVIAMNPATYSITPEQKIIWIEDPYEITQRFPLPSTSYISEDPTLVPGVTTTQSDHQTGTETETTKLPFSITSASFPYPNLTIQTRNISNSSLWVLEPRPRLTDEQLQQYPIQTGLIEWKQEFASPALQGFPALHNPLRIYKASDDLYYLCYFDQNWSQIQALVSTETSGFYENRTTTTTTVDYTKTTTTVTIIPQPPQNNYIQSNVYPNLKLDSDNDFYMLDASSTIVSLEGPEAVMSGDSNFKYKIETKTVEKTIQEEIDKSQSGTYIDYETKMYREIMLRPPESPPVDSFVRYQFAYNLYPDMCISDLGVAFPLQTLINGIKGVLHLTKPWKWFEKRYTNSLIYLFDFKNEFLSQRVLNKLKENGIGGGWDKVFDENDIVNRAIFYPPWMKKALSWGGYEVETHLTSRPFKTSSGSGDPEIISTTQGEGEPIIEYANTLPDGLDVGTHTLYSETSETTSHMLQPRSYSHDITEYFHATLKNSRGHIPWKRIHRNGLWSRIADELDPFPFLTDQFLVPDLGTIMNDYNFYDPDHHMKIYAFVGGFQASTPTTNSLYRPEKAQTNFSTRTATALFHVLVEFPIDYFECVLPQNNIYDPYAPYNSAYMFTYLGESVKRSEIIKYEKTITEQDPMYSGNIHISYRWKNLASLIMSPLQSLVLIISGVNTTNEIMPINTSNNDSNGNIVQTIPIIENYYSFASTLAQLSDELIIVKDDFDDTAKYRLPTKGGTERNLQFAMKYVTKDGQIHQLYIPPTGVFNLQLTFKIYYSL